MIHVLPVTVLVIRPDKDNDNGTEEGKGNRAIEGRDFLLLFLCLVLDPLHLLHLLLDAKGLGRGLLIVPRGKNHSSKILPPVICYDNF